MSLKIGQLDPKLLVKEEDQQSFPPKPVSHRSFSAGDPSQQPSLISLDFNSRLFRHYKNKPYRFHSIAKHSETLEEFVVYEACYANPESKFWIRPKEMFFGQVHVGPRSFSRFEQVPLFLRKVTQFSDEDIVNVKHLCELIFAEWNERRFRARIAESKNPMMIMAHIDSVPVGFKLGYEISNEVFYSWLGGVSPKFRHYGFGLQMAKAQIEWCKNRAYKKLQMKTRNRFPQMIALNLKLGFEIIGVELRDDGDREIIMELKL